MKHGICGAVAALNPDCVFLQASLAFRRLNVLDLPRGPGKNFGHEITGLKHGHFPQLFFISWVPTAPGGQLFRVKMSTLTLH